MQVKRLDLSATQDAHFTRPHAARSALSIELLSTVEVPTRGFCHNGEAFVFEE